MCAPTAGVYLYNDPRMSKLNNWGCYSGLDNLWFESPDGQETFLQNKQTSSGAHPASYCKGIWSSTPPGVKWPASEADHSFLLSVKFEWNYASSPSLCLHGIYGNAFTFRSENFRSVRHAYYVQMVCWPILFLPHVAESVVCVVILFLVVVGVVAEVIAVLLRSGAGGFVALVLLCVVVLMTVVITVVVVLVKATFCVAWNTVKLWAFHTFEEDR